MKLTKIACLALFSALGLSLTAKADSLSWNFTYTGSDGVTATGTVTGSQSVSTPWAYLLTSGTINISGAPDCTTCGSSPVSLDGPGTLVADVNEILYVGGNTSLSGQDNLLFYPADPAIDNAGWLFQLSSGSGVSLWGDGPGEYAMRGGDGTFQDTGTLSFTPTPEPGSFLLFGTGLLGFGWVLFAKRRAHPSAQSI